MPTVRLTINEVEMPNQDAVRWDTRYRSGREIYIRKKPNRFLAAHVSLLPVGGRVLDLACGAGRNALFLAACGFQVVGVDISHAGLAIAAHRAIEQQLELMLIQADLAHFGLPPASFDGIVNCYYLERALFPVIRRALRPGGVLIFETFTLKHRDFRPNVAPNNLLAPGELYATFADWEILVYREAVLEETVGHRKAVASLVARKTGSNEHLEVW